MAAAKNHAEIAELILADSRFTSANALVSEEKRSALSIAAVKANWDVLNVLVNHPSIDLGVKHKNGLTLEELSRYCLSSQSYSNLTISGTARMQHKGKRLRRF